MVAGWLLSVVGRLNGDCPVTFAHAVDQSRMESELLASSQFDVEADSFQLGVHILVLYVADVCQQCTRQNRQSEG